MSYSPHSETDDETGITFKMEHDPDAESPLSNDDAVIMAVLHRQYDNPAQGVGLTDQEALEAFERANCKGKRAKWKAFPLYMLDHSGTVYRVGEHGNPFSCPWDSGRVGTLFVNLAEVGDALSAAVATCEQYTSWANGEAFGYVIEGPDGDTLDSCWGYVGPYDGYGMEQGREAFEAHKAIARAALAAALEAERPDLYSATV